MPDPLEQRINDQLQAIAQNPVQQMDAQPQKYDASGVNPIKGASAFDQVQIDKRSFVDARDWLRQDTLARQAANPSRAPFLSNDRAENLVDEYRYSALSAMDSNKMMSSTLAVSPWSDDYWGLYLGVIGCRYADPSFPSLSDWKKNYDYIVAQPPASILGSGNASAIDRLSPAEKYDALVGDDSFTLTRSMWNEGRVYYDRTGTVETWMGICHGWSPAAYMLARPTTAVAVIAANGTSLTFYPSDIKALASLLWANVGTSSRFIGGRCDVKNPERDPQNGRIIAQACFDTNPGTWQLSVVNQIGASQRSTVMDATYDYEVWNQPILSYQYRYFNPQSMQVVGSLAEAQVMMANFTNDRFKHYRSSAAVSVVGIAMDVAYIVETRPSHATSDAPANDNINRVTYVYDVEQDAMGGIIGGEWYSNKHPDFLWTPPPGEKATTPSDALAVGVWRKNERLPAAWQQAGRQAAAANKAPLASIVDSLIGFANS